MVAEQKPYPVFSRSEILLISFLFVFNKVELSRGNLRKAFYLRWGYSSAGRAPALQAGSHRFEPDYLHHIWAHSSAGQSTRLISVRSMVRVHLSPPPERENKALNERKKDNCGYQEKKINNCIANSFSFIIRKIIRRVRKAKDFSYQCKANLVNAKDVKSNFKVLKRCN